MPLEQYALSVYVAAVSESGKSTDCCFCFTFQAASCPLRMPWSYMFSSELPLKLGRLEGTLAV
jgi:hypothetical protein